jgi:hypothetical protein
MSSLLLVHAQLDLRVLPELFLAVRPNTHLLCAQARRVVAKLLRHAPSAGHGERTPAPIVILFLRALPQSLVYSWLVAQPLV